MDGTRYSHYELRRLIGRGGMGEVYEAFDLKARRGVALKFVAAAPAADPEAFRRFEAEALHAASMSHPHIATLYEFEPEGERPFIAMELVRGSSLRARIHRGPLAIPDALAIARDVASALAYAHRRGVVHRDIKPENLMFDEEGRVKVMDFGLARALEGTRLTVAGTSLGTPAYMAPEAIQGSAGPEADVFALGLVLAEMLTGTQVFRGDTAMSVMFAIMNAEAPRLRTLRPEVPEPVEELVARMVAKDAALRPSAFDAARRLAELTGAPIPVLPADPAPGSGGDGLRGAAQLSSARTVPLAAPSDAVTAPMPAPPVASGAITIGMASRGAPVRARLRNPLALVAALLVVVVLAGAWMMVRAAGAARAHRAAVVLNNQAHAALAHGDLAQARDLVARALAREPGYGEALLNRGMIYDAAGQPDSAGALYDAVVRARSSSRSLAAMALYNLGDIDFKSGAPQQAADHLGRSFAYDSSRWEIYNNLGYALILAGRPGDALPLLQRGIARFSGAAPLYKNAALALLATDQDSAALAHADRALARDANLTAARALKARLEARLGHRAAALAEFRRYVLARPDSAERAQVERELAERGVAIGP